MQTRYSHAKLETISDDSMANYDLDAILREVNDIDKNVIRTEEAERALVPRRGSFSIDILATYMSPIATRSRPTFYHNHLSISQWIYKLIAS